MELACAVLDTAYRVRLGPGVNPEPFRLLLLEARRHQGPWVPCEVFKEQGQVRARLGGRSLRPVPTEEDLAFDLECVLAEDALRRLTGIGLHAAAVTWNGKGLLLPGRSGAGKTTLALALCVRGARIISDEVIHLPRATIRVTGYARAICISGHTRALLVPLGAEPLLAPARAIGGRAVLRADDLPLERAPVTPRWVVFPSVSLERPCIRPLTPGQTAARLLNFAYGARRRANGCLPDLSRLAEVVRGYDLRSGPLPETLSLLEGALGAPASLPFPA